MSASSGRLGDDQRRTRVLVVLGAPALAAFFAYWLPMFRAVSPEGTDDELVVHDDTWTLLGVALDPGDGGQQTTIRVLALLALALLACCAYAALAPDGSPVARLLPWAAGLALAAGLLLLLVTVQDDGSGRFGTDTVQPVGASWLLVILPLWFLAARDVARRA